MSDYISPGVFNFTMKSKSAIYKGAQWLQTFSLSENGTPVDLTGFIGSCAIKASATESNIVARPVVDIIDPENGVFTLSLTASETRSILTRGETYSDVAEYQYDVYLTKDGETFRALHGYAEVSPNIGG